MAATKIIEMYATFRRYREEMEFKKQIHLEKSKINKNKCISKIGQKSSKQKGEINSYISVIVIHRKETDSEVKTKMKILIQLIKFRYGLYIGNII